MSYSFNEFQIDKKGRGGLNVYTKEEEKFFTEIVEYLRQNKKVPIKGLVKFSIEKGYIDRKFNTVYCIVRKRLKEITN